MRGSHHLGEPCDICNGEGVDYIGRQCRRWDKDGDPNYPPPERGPLNRRVLFFGGPMNEQVVAVRAGESVMLAPVPERVSYSLAEPLDPIGSAIRTIRYDIKNVAAIGQMWRVGVAEGYPEQRIIAAMNVVLTLCSLPICAARTVAP